MNEKLIEPTNPQNLGPVPVEPLYPTRDETKMVQQNIEYPKPAYQEVNVQSDPTKINVTLPIIQTTSPSYTSVEISFKTSNLPKFFFKLETCIFTFSLFTATV